MKPKYVHVEGGGIVRLYAAIPYPFKGVRRFDLLTAQEQAVAGLLPLVDVTPYQDPALMVEEQKEPSYTVFKDRVEMVRAWVPILLANAKAARLRWISERLEAILAAGVEFGGHTWDVGPAYRSALTSVVVAANIAGAVPLNFTWRNSNDVAVPLTLPQLVALHQAMVTFLYNTHRIAGLRRDAVRAATSTAEVKDVPE